VGVTFDSSLGSAFNNTSGTTLAITTTANIDIGDLVVVRWASDNLSATTPTATCADGSANSYVVQRQAAGNATAAAGIAGGILTCLATVARPSGSTITLTFSGAITGKAAYAESFQGVLNATRVAVVGTGAVSGTASSTGASAAGVLAGDLCLGFSAVQSRTAATGDADSTGGTWSTKVGVNGGGTSGQDATSVQINGQYKITTAGGAQTYDNTVTSTYWVNGLVVLQRDPNNVASIATNWGGWSGTSTAVVERSASITTSWDTWNAQAAGTVTSAAVEYFGTINDNWGTWSATSAAFIPRPATIADNWGTWTAAATALAIDHPATTATAWGTWTATATVAFIERYGTITSSWGLWSASAAATVFTPAAWGIPQNVLATTTGITTITVTWDAIPAATGYDIERNGAVIKLDHLTSPYNDSGLSPDTLYSYRVRAVG
jgi:hypothetical protein